LVVSDYGKTAFGRSFCFDARFDRAASVATRDVDDVLATVTSGNGDGLRRAARHIGPVGRRDIRRIAMRPVPGHVIAIGIIMCIR